MDYYEILCVPRDASAADIERAFRAVARRVHPDLNLGDGNADARMKQLNHIRDTLADPLLRAAYDDRLRQEAAAPAAPARSGRADGGRPERTTGSRFRASWTAPHARWRASDKQGSQAASPPNREAPPLPAFVHHRPRRLAAFVLVFLPVVAVLAIRWGRDRRGSAEPTEAAVQRADSPLLQAATSIPRIDVSGGGPRAVMTSLPKAGANEAAARRLSLVDPESRAPGPGFRARAGQRRGGVVHVGSTRAQVLGAFGRPDRIDSGARPGDATMVYGDLRLEFRNGKLATGAAHRLQNGNSNPAANPKVR